MSLPSLIKASPARCASVMVRSSTSRAKGRSSSPASAASIAP
uniref:Uncharacterized protein n=1 Tax=Arundo donax TaxID=35708 RepID=A0A0A9C7S6_ARUDO